MGSQPQVGVNMWISICKAKNPRALVAKMLEYKSETNVSDIYRKYSSEIE